MARKVTTTSVEVPRKISSRISAPFPVPSPKTLDLEIPGATTLSCVQRGLHAAFFLTVKRCCGTGGLRMCLDCACTRPARY